MFRVRWEPFQLRPNCPMEGMTLEQLGYPPERMKEARKRLKEVGKSIGLKFAEKRDLIPNTLMAHLLTDYAENHGGASKQNEVADRLLTAYFGDGINLDKAFLLKVAADVGFDVDDVAAFITDNEQQNNMKKKAKSWSDQGVHGVPFFIMNGIPTFAGAQDSSIFKSTILKIAEKHPLKKGEEKSSL